MIDKLGYTISYQTKYRQINNYLGSNDNPKKWLALEEDAENWYPGHLDKLIHTNGETGLSDPRVMKLLMEKLAEYDSIS